MEHTCGSLTSVEDHYQYEPLIAGDAVRVLNLEPANDFESPLRGFISQHRLTVESVEPDGCGYSAVSYTWGDPTPSHKLRLRLNTQWVFLPITRNADLLLRHLRDAHKITPLWIDGVCLNQKDEGEKGQQIPLMGQIYAHAKRVHIWLGDDEIEDARRAFSLIRRIELGGMDGLSPGTSEFLFLEKFFNRPWFTRRWIIQETVFAHDAVLHCGHHTMSLSRVMNVLAKASSQGWSELPGWGLRMLKSAIGSGQMQSPRQGLLSLLWNLHESECTDKRDRIAAVYAFADNSERAPLQYDVEDWKKLYTDVASYYLHSGTSTAQAILLHLCDFGSIKSNSDDEVPFWVPNWSKKREDLIPFGAREGAPINPLREYKLALFLGFNEVIYRLFFTLFPGLRSENKQWKQKERQAWEKQRQGYGGDLTSLNLIISEHKLRINYDFFTFINACGIVDQVICPSLSENFWEEIVGLVRWQETRFEIVKAIFKSDQAVIPENERHKMEVDSLKSLLVSMLAGRDPTPVAALSASKLSEAVDRLCAGLKLVSGRDDGSNFHTPNQHQDQEILREFRSVIKHLALLRVQATVGYYWAIGPPDLVKGDWLVPIVPQGERVARRPEPRIIPFLFLREVGAEERGKVWYPSITSDPNSRLRRLAKSKLPEDGSVHINAKFVGSGGGCLHSFSYYSELLYHQELWRILLRATEAANKKGLPGPIVFDILWDA